VALAILAAITIGATTRMSRPALIAKPTPQLVPEQRSPDVKVVKTIPIIATPKPEPRVTVTPPPTRNYRAPDEIPPHPYLEPEPPKKKVRTKKREYERGDICRGKGKRYTNNGRSWRCKR